MVAVLVIALLIAIAIPTFMGARQKAQGRAAQSNLRNALAAMKVGYVEGQSYVMAAAQLASIEPSMRYASGAGASSDGQGLVAVRAVDAQNVGMAVFSADGVCWELFDSTASGGGTTFDSIPNSTRTTCTAPGAALSRTSW